jgi:hypothetical protein
MMSDSGFYIGEGDVAIIDGEEITVDYVDGEGVVYYDESLRDYFEESLEDFQDRLRSAKHWKVKRYDDDGELEGSVYGFGDEVVQA